MEQGEQEAATYAKNVTGTDESIKIFQAFMAGHKKGWEQHIGPPMIGMFLMGIILGVGVAGIILRYWVCGR